MLEEVEAKVEEADLEAVVEIRICSKLKKTSPMEEDVVTLEAGGVDKSNSRGLKCKGVIASVHMVNIGIGVCLRVC